MDYTCIIVLVLLIIYILYCQLSQSKVIRFYRPSCRHCVESEGEWKKFRAMSLANSYVCSEINTSEMSPSEQELFEQMGLKGVPALVLITKDGRRYKYEGDRTATGYMDWVQKKL